MDLLREYNAGGLGTHSDIIYVLGSLGAVIPSYLIRNMVTSLFPDLVQWEPNMLYMVYIPPGVVVVRDNGTSSISNFDGYHEQAGGGPSGAFPFTIGVVCPWNNGSSSYNNSEDRLTITSSHEICEAITDPNTGWQNTGWPYYGWLGAYNGPDGKLGSPIEIGDECYKSRASIGGYAIQGVWSRRQAACAIEPWPLLSMPFAVKNSPAIGTNGKELFVAWTERLHYPGTSVAEPFGNILVMMNNFDGLDFSGPIILQSDYQNNETSIDSPALSEGPGNTIYIAWTGTDSPNHHINIRRYLGPSIRSWGEKSVLDEWTNTNPALAFESPSDSFPNGVMFLAFTGTNNRLYFRWSFDGSNWPDSNKKELLQWSLNGPSICFANGFLYLAFRATTGDRIFVCRTQDFGKTLEVATIPNQHTDYGPALTLVGTNLFIAWRSVDNPDGRFYAMTTDVTSSDPLNSFTNLVQYGDQSSGSVSLATNPHDGRPYITWAGTDSGFSLNIMPLPPYLQSCYS